ncbi:MAG: hypothetical protein NZ739_10735, partial [Verrucomicrobiae bacterium]|nr:hypothetical protein [Verrucomicrobiae bacterium]
MRQFAIFLVCAGFSVALQAQVLQSYVNYGAVYDPAQIPQAVVNFTNRGTIQISLATGSSDVSAQPFETFATLNFVNKPGTFWNSGTMVASPGWRFVHKPLSTGRRQMASSFICENGAIVLGLDPVIYVYWTYEDVPYTLPPVVAPVQPSYLIVWATNIVVRGGISGSGSGTRASLVVGPNGVMELRGVNVDLKYAGIEVLPVWATPIGSGYIGDPPTNFVPDIAIQDVYWAATNFTENFRLNSAALWNGITAQSPSVPANPVASPGFELFYPIADSYVDIPDGAWLPVVVTNVSGSPTNIPGVGTNLLLVRDFEVIQIALPTNIMKGAIFADVGPGVGIALGFTNATELGRTAVVLLGGYVTNVVTLESDLAFIYIEDTLASSTNRGLVWNLTGAGSEVMTARPVNYYIDRQPWGYGLPGDGVPEPYFFVRSGVGAYLQDPSLIGYDFVTNASVPNGDCSAYGSYVDNVVSRPSPLPGATVTNLPGRLSITASNLDLSFTRIRGEGFVRITAENLVSTTNAVIDCENLFFDLDNKKGTVLAQNLARSQAGVFRGEIYLWSAVWSNVALVIITNNYSLSNVTQEVISGDGTTNYVTNIVAVASPLTNQVSMRLHAFMVDARGLGVGAPVYVHEFVTRSTNTIVKDNLTVIQTLRLLGKSLSVDGAIVIPGTVPPVNPILVGYWDPIEPLRDWRFNCAPNLLYFTNRGTIQVANEAHFGDDMSRGYETFINSGTIRAASIHVRSMQVENRGLLQSDGYHELWADTVKLESGSTVAGGDFVLKSRVLKLNNYAAQVGAGVELWVTNTLSDAGPGSGNVISVGDGFRLFVKPQNGDLLGTEIQSAAPNVPAIEIVHIWAGTNRGAVPAGYSNNVAIGKLALRSRALYPRFYFAGTANGNAKNAIYVDVLDITELGPDFTNKIAIETNLVIYFAAANIGFTPPLRQGQVQLPEEFLDGQFGGRLRWASTYAGPGSSIEVVSNGVPIRVNLALRSSRIIDSDG